MRKPEEIKQDIKDKKGAIEILKDTILDLKNELIATSDIQVGDKVRVTNVYKPWNSSEEVTNVDEAICANIVVEDWWDIELKHTFKKPSVKDPSKPGNINISWSGKGKLEKL